MSSNEQSGFSRGKIPVSLLDQEKSQHTLHRVAAVVVPATCVWVLLTSGLTLIGWARGSERLLHFPTPVTAGTMMPATAVLLLLAASDLWLVRDESRAFGPRLAWERIVGAVLTFFGAVFIWEFARGAQLPIDTLLFPQTLDELLPHLPGRPSVGSCISLTLVGVAL